MLNIAEKTVTEGQEFWINKRMALFIQNSFPLVADSQLYLSTASVKVIIFALSPYLCEPVLFFSRHQAGVCVFYSLKERLYLPDTWNRFQTLQDMTLLASYAREARPEAPESLPTRPFVL